jgi:hypothetical protein
MAPKRSGHQDARGRDSILPRGVSLSSDDSPSFGYVCPFVDPMSCLQVELLARYRKARAKHIEADERRTYNPETSPEERM